MKVAEQIRNAQDQKEMTRRAVKMLEALGEDVTWFKEEFLKMYGEELDPKNQELLDDLLMEQQEQM